MNTPATVMTPRHTLVAALLCVVVLFSVVPGARAGDPDDDWGLPKATSQGSNGSGGSTLDGRGSDDGGNTSQSTVLPDVAVDGEMIQAELDLREARFFVDRKDGDDTVVATTGSSESAEAALTVPAGSVLRLQPLTDGGLVQGAALVQPGGDLSVVLQAAPDSAAGAAFLVLDGPAWAAPTSLSALLDGVEQGVAPAAVLAYESLGELQTLDVASVHALAVQYGPLLQDAGVSHLSVLAVSLDPSGKLRTSGVRMPVGGGPVEIETR
jgi:hypothetical protein